MSPISLRGDGEDSVGKFSIAVPGWCHVCEREEGLSAGAQDAAIQYKWPEGVREWFDKLGFSVEATILKDPEKESLGISCGHYAKFQRQVAHIVSKRKASGKKKNKKRG